MTNVFMCCVCVCVYVCVCVCVNNLFITYAESETFFAKQKTLLPFIKQFH